MNWIQVFSLIAPDSTQVGNDEFPCMFRPSQPAQAEAAIASRRTAVGVEAKVGAAGGAVDHDVVQALAVAQQVFVILVLSVGIGIAENDPAYSPIR